MKMRKLLAFSVCVITLILLTVTSVAAAEIFVSSTGSDSNDGLSAATAVATFEQAYALIGNDDGTIKVVDNMTYSAGAAHTGVVTVKGTSASVKLTLPSEVSLNGKTTFETLTLSGEATIYANANALVVQSDVTSDSLLTVFGGSNGTWTSPTSVKLYGGQYTRVYGGGNKSGASGSEIVLGGNANPNDSGTDDGTCVVYGGAYQNYVTNTKVTIEGNAKTKYVYGSGNWGNSKTSKVYIKGGEVMNVFGGSYAGGITGTATVEMTGGTVEAIFGANQANLTNGTEYGSFTGDAKVVVKGGEVTRRIYGGTYNNYGLSGYSTSQYVAGSTLVVVYPEAKLSNCGLFGGSRVGSNNADEVNTILFVDNAYDKYSGRIGKGDLTSRHDYIVKDTLNGDVLHVNGKPSNVLYIKPDLGYVGTVGNAVYKNEYITLSAADTTVNFVKALVVDAENCTITAGVDQTIDLKKYASFEKHGDGYFFNGWKVNGAYVPLGEDRVYAAKAGDVLTAVSTAISYETTGDMYTLGAQIREAANGKYDLRFVTQFARDFLATDVLGITTYGGENVQYGHLVLPKEDKFMSTEEFGKITGNGITGDNDLSFIESEELLEIGKASLTGETPKIVPAVKLYEAPSDDYIKFTVCITSITTKNYDRIYAVRPYVKYTDGNGVERVVYGEQYSLSSVNNTLEGVNG